jgi:hypothetical protein
MQLVNRTLMGIMNNRGRRDTFYYSHYYLRRHNIAMDEIRIKGNSSKKISTDMLTFFV